MRTRLGHAQGFSRFGDAAASFARTAASFRWSVVALVLANAAGFEVLVSRTGGSEGLAAADYAAAAEMRLNWPQFRGPGGDGLVPTNPPAATAAQEGAAIAWQVELPAPGFNSPIIWEERLFVCGGDAAKREIFCYGTRAGELLWRLPVENVPGSPAEPPEIPEQAGYAPSTMATDGRRVYAIFANGDVAAFSLDGRPVWAKNLGVPRNPYGHASSLVTWQGRLLVQFDQGEVEQNLSKLYAIDGATGRVVWHKARPVSVSWATPMVVEAAGKPQIITLSVPWVIAYHAESGVELWRFEGLHSEVTPSPARAGEVILATTPNESVTAIRADGHGDVTKTHVQWTAEDNVPDISSPVANRELVFTVNTPGMLTCFDAKDGKKLWEHDLAMECHASPTAAGNRVFVVATQGVLIAVEAGRAFKEVARTELGERVFASPAFARGKIFMRGMKHLFCIAPGQGPAEPHLD